MADIYVNGSFERLRVYGANTYCSGSHTMSFVLARDEKWPAASALTPVILGPFPSLRNGVTGHDPNKPDAPPSPAADFFMWEQFTTKPYFEPTPSSPSPPLKKVGEIATPWSSWHIAASSATFPSPENDERLAKLFQVLDGGIAAFEKDTAGAVQLLGTGELGCTYSEEDAKEWLEDVRFVRGGTRGVDMRIVENVVDILKDAGVVSQETGNDEVKRRVTAILK